MKKIYSLICFLISSSLLTSCSSNMKVSYGEEYISAAYYFSDEQPMNFWNSEWDEIDKELEQIHIDGFNTIAVVVPWREFQPGISPIEYNETAWTRLAFLFEKANEHSLDVIVRAGYLYDFFEEEDPATRFYRIVGDSQVQCAWYEYMERLYNTCNNNDNFIGAFITWEEFWHNYALVDYVGGTEAGLSFARQEHLDSFLSQRYTLDEFNTKYNTKFVEFEDIPVPSRADRYMVEWYEYIDNFTCMLLNETRNIFPSLYMVARTDKDKVIDENGDITWYSHTKTWNIANVEKMGIMYRISQGLEVSQKELTTKDATKSLQKWLHNIYKENGGIPIFIEEFLFYDNTPGVSGGKLILNIDAEQYFVDCVPILKKYTCGYGVWAYKDYCNNLLYNPQFALLLEGWDATESVICGNKDSSNAVNLCGGGITQDIPYWRKSISTDEGLFFSMNYDTEEKEVTFSVQVGNDVKKVTTKGKGVMHFVFANDDSELLLCISCNENAWIDNIKLYDFVTTQELYDMDNAEKKFIKSLRCLNDLLRK